MSRNPDIVDGAVYYAADITSMKLEGNIEAELKKPVVDWAKVFWNGVGIVGAEYVKAEANKPLSRKFRSLRDSKNQKNIQKKRRERR